MLTGAQIRMARAALRMDQAELARLAEISVDSVKRAEGFDGEPKAQLSTLTAIQRVFERAGLYFEGGGVGVGARRPTRRYMQMIAEIEDLVGATLMLELGPDPELFDKGIEHVADKLARCLDRPILEGIVRRVMRGEKI